MKIDNFKLVKTEGRSYSDWVYRATVDVETGSLWWKKTETLEVRREYGGYWHFVETGEFCPGICVETLARSWEAKTGEQC